MLALCSHVFLAIYYILWLLYQSIDNPPECFIRECESITIFDRICTIIIIRNFGLKYIFDAWYLQSAFCHLHEVFHYCVVIQVSSVHLTLQWIASGISLHFRQFFSPVSQTCLRQYHKHACMGVVGRLMLHELYLRWPWAQLRPSCAEKYTKSC